jgi:N-methylhydantoinase A
MEPYLPTVTDAHLILGHLDASREFAGGMNLNRGAAEKALLPLAQRLGMSLTQAAYGILRVAEATMMRAIQRVSMEKGYDPRNFVLVPFGGAGGLHACRLAEEVGISSIWVPRHQGLLSAVGMLCAPLLYTFSRSWFCSLSCDEKGFYPLPQAQDGYISLYQSLANQADTAMQRDGVPKSEQRERCFLGMRYEGQSYSLSILLEDSISPVESFLRQHHSLYGYLVPRRAIEVVSLRLERGAKPPSLSWLSPASSLSSSIAPSSSIPSIEIFHSGEVSSTFAIPRVERSSLPVGARWKGSVLVDEPSATLLLLEGWEMEVLPSLSLLLKKVAT